MLFIRFSWARSPHSSLMYLVAVASVAGGTSFFSSSSKREAGEVRAAEHARQRFRPHRADLVVRVEQEEAFLHGLQNVARLLLRFPRHALAAAAGELEISRRGGQNQGREHTGRQQQRAGGAAPEDACVCSCVATPASWACRRLVLSLREELRALHVGVVRAAFLREGAAASSESDVGLAVEVDHRIDHRAVLVPQQQRLLELLRSRRSRRRRAA